MRGAPPDTRLVRAFRRLLQTRQEMRADGASQSECSAALEEGVRAVLPVVAESEWPYWARLPRCVRCDGYGLVIRSVVNRLRLTVNEATPCSCQAGVRFQPKSAAQEDYTQAGKLPPKPKGWQRL